MTNTRGDDDFAPFSTLTQGGLNVQWDENVVDRFLLQNQGNKVWILINL